MNEVIVLLLAETELQEAYNRYDEFGLGNQLETQVNVVLEHLAHHAFLGAVYHGRIRRVLLRRFPFALFYTVEGRRIMLQAFLDSRQDPELVRRRLGH